MTVIVSPGLAHTARYNASPSELISVEDRYFWALNPDTSRPLRPGAREASNARAIASEAARRLAAKCSRRTSSIPPTQLVYVASGHPRQMAWPRHALNHTPERLPKRSSIHDRALPTARWDFRQD